MLPDSRATRRSLRARATHSETALGASVATPATTELEAVIAVATVAAPAVWGATSVDEVSPDAEGAVANEVSVAVPLTRRQLREMHRAEAGLVSSSPQAPPTRVSIDGRPEAAESVDAFELALRNLGTAPAAFSTRASVAAAPASRECVASPIGPLGRTQSRLAGLARRAAAGAFTVSVMTSVGLLAFAATASPEAAASASREVQASVESVAVSSEAVAEAENEVQAFVTNSQVDVDLNRGGNTYTSVTVPKVANVDTIGNTSDLFVSDPSAAIRWPFPVGVPVTDTWGPRWGSFHHGVDFVPGDGAEIQAIADGVVTISTEAGGVFGVQVMIEHEIDGKKFSTNYAHMQYGSLRVSQGQTVEAGEVIGLVGNTGLSFGSHLHFEVYIGGARVDPLAWLQQNAG